ncbi:MAG TPA: hypothetical protein VNO82_03490 [Solirubrobacteraceae bacterium]|nr:hypothetical protein [Solirubrobacteraceae bacterium]
MSRRVGRFVVAVMVTVGLATAPPALADEQVASSGQVEATLTFTEAEFGYDFHVAIDRAGQRLLDAPLDVCCSSPAYLYENKDSVFVRDLDGDGEPEVWVDVPTRASRTRSRRSAAPAIRCACSTTAPESSPT